MEVEGSFVTHVSVPSQKEVEDMLVRRKKRVRPCGGRGVDTIGSCLEGDITIVPVICFPRLPSPNAVQELLDKYTSDTLIQQEEEAKALLGYS